MLIGPTAQRLSTPTGQSKIRGRGPWPANALARRWLFGGRKYRLRRAAVPECQEAAA